MTKIAITTKADILDRLKAGPAQFSEFAGTRSHKSKARIAARKICDELESDGFVRQVYIGKYRYYILNNKMAESKAVTQQIEENSRYSADSGCTVWTSYSDKERGPVMRQSIAGPSAVNVRRWIWEQNTGETLNGTKESIKMRACCDGNCIDFKHMVKKSRSQLLKGKVQTISTRIKMSRKLADKYNKGKDLVETIRVSEKGSAELAREHGMSRSNVWQIRTGKTFKLESTHFSGLGARA